MMAVDSLREQGEKVGLVRLRLWRPFPFDELRNAVSSAKTLIVLDRALSFGGPYGPVCSEVKAALYPLQNKPAVISFIAGLGGRDITANTFEDMIRNGVEKAGTGRLDELEMIEVRQS